MSEPRRSRTRTSEVSGPSRARAGRGQGGFLPVVVDTLRRPDPSQSSAGEGPPPSLASAFFHTLGYALCLAILFSASMGWLELAMAWVLGVV